MCDCRVASHGDDDAQNSAFLYLWILAEVVRTCYTLTWDIKMDWGLLDKNAGENRLLREEIVYPRKVCELSSKAKVKKVKANSSSWGDPHLRATGCHLPYGITQCCLPPDTSECAPPNPSHAGWYSIYLPRRDGRLS